MSDVRSHEALLTSTTGCFGSLVDMVLNGYCDLIVDDIINHTQVNPPSFIFQCGNENIIYHSRYTSFSPIDAAFQTCSSPLDCF